MVGNVDNNGEKTMGTENKTETKTEQKTKPDTEKLSSNQQVGITLECPSCSKEFTRETPEKAFNAVRGHWMGTKNEQHKGRFPYTLADFGLGEGESPQRIQPTEALTEPLPDSLENLEKILDEHGIRRKAVVLRSMSLREPNDLQDLMWSLDDIGVNRSRQRRIISDYAKWLGIQVPEPVMEALSPRTQSEFEPTPRYDRWGRRVTEERRGSGRGNGMPSDYEGVAQIFESVARVINSSRPQNAEYNPEADAYQQQLMDEKAESQRLRDKLREAEIEGLRQEFNAKLAEQKAENADKDEKTILLKRIDKGLERGGNLGERLIDGALRTEFPEQAPERKRIGKSGIINLIPEELME